MIHELFGPPISTYTRAQAIEDGVLVDITEQARQQRFVFPMAMTSALWDKCTAENLRAPVSRNMKCTREVVR